MQLFVLGAFALVAVASAGSISNTYLPPNHSGAASNTFSSYSAPATGGFGAASFNSFAEPSNHIDTYAAPAPAASTSFSSYSAPASLASSSFVAPLAAPSRQYLAPAFGGISSGHGHGSHVGHASFTKSVYSAPAVAASTGFGSYVAPAATVSHASYAAPSGGLGFTGGLGGHSGGTFSFSPSGSSAADSGGLFGGHSGAASTYSQESYAAPSFQLYSAPAVSSHASYAAPATAASFSQPSFVAPVGTAINRRTYVAPSSFGGSIGALGGVGLDTQYAANGGYEYRRKTK